MKNSKFCFMLGILCCLFMIATSCSSEDEEVNFQNCWVDEWALKEVLIKQWLEEIELHPAYNKELHNDENTYFRELPSCELTGWYFDSSRIAKRYGLANE